MTAPAQEQPKTPERSESGELESEMFEDDSGSIADTSIGGAYHSDETQPITESGLAQKETVLVQRSKIVVYCVLLLAATIVATTIFLFIRAEEESQFEAEFISLAGEVITVAENNAFATFGVVKSLSVAMTSYAESTNQTWPFVTIPHFEARGQEALELSGAELIAFLPNVFEADERRWEDYARNNADWLREGLAFRGLPDIDPGSIPRRIHDPFQDQGDFAFSVDLHLKVPVWQVTPAPTDAEATLTDMFATDWFRRLAVDVLENEKVLLSKVVDLEWLLQYSRGFSKGDNPRSVLLQPVFDTIEPDGQSVVGFVMAVIPWETYFLDLAPPGTGTITVYVNDTCKSEFNYIIKGTEAEFKEGTDIHDRNYEYLKQETAFAEFARFDLTDEDTINNVHCDYTLSVYPTSDFEDDYKTTQPVIFAFVVMAVFLFTAVVFVAYDCLVQRRQDKVMSTAERTTAIVSSLFPKSVRSRIMEDVHAEVSHDLKARRRGYFGAKTQLKEFLGADIKPSKDQADGDGMFYKTRPIADLFPQTTILFADIVGFTAWSSTREPSQVFMLLETIYHEFDEIAIRRRVFKVETVGDCYVAAVGLPDPRKDHAVVMARFARDCLVRMQELVKILERQLGPDTADLGMRFGIHSGPVTAGVLRGERARFQLFGDTVNTTARMESTGEMDRIHLSKETAELLTAAGKSNWIRPRAEMVMAKGKGALQTYWLELKNDVEKDSHEEDPQDALGRLEGSRTKVDEVTPRISQKQARLIDWNTDVLSKLLKDILSRRKAARVKPDPFSLVHELEIKSLQRDGTVLDEVAEIITLPKFDPQAAEKEVDTVALNDKVVQQLHDYIQTISVLYRDNPFHNFEHVSHVTMSVTKLLSRIVAPDLNVDEAQEKTLHDHTYGITSDPLTQFAVVFSALIHDVDHQGVPNSQLVKENVSIASVYKNKSVAEQNSVDIAWDLLMEEEFIELRRAIYTTREEFKRFRRLVVNAVMATDIMDKDLGAARKARWNKAFAEGSPVENEMEDTNRKATIVIEHLIQASDVSHTMQHWHIYRKWNARLFAELYRAYKDGRSASDPSENWYKGEMGFFDFYIIPLAKKLKDCGVFGVSSDEYLNYAMQNRQEWENRGQEIVAEMVENVTKSSAPTASKPTVSTKLPAVV